MVAKPCPGRIAVGPARPILPQPRLPRTRAARARKHPRSQPQTAALPLYRLCSDLRRYLRYPALPPQEADRAGDHRADLALPRLSAASDRRRLRARPPVAGADAGDGGRADGSLLDDA